MKFKTCTACVKEKYFSDFKFDFRRKKPRSVCKECESKNAKEYYKKNKTKILAKYHGQSIEEKTKTGRLAYKRKLDKLRNKEY